MVQFGQKIRRVLSSEHNFQTNLRCKRDAHSRTGAEEIPQRALGDLELLQSGDRFGLGAVGVRANLTHVRYTVLIGLHLGCGHWELSHVDGVICTGIVTVEEVEELHERINLQTLVIFYGAGNAQVRLDIGFPSEFVEARIHTVDPDTSLIVGAGDGDWPGALKLGDAAQLETTGNM